MNTITADEARQLTRPSQLEIAYEEIRHAAKNGKSQVKLKGGFWSVESIDRKNARSHLECNGFKVKNLFRSGGYDEVILVSW